MCRPEGYCKNSRQRREFKCHFNFQKECRDTTRLEFNDLENGKVKAKIATKRNNGNINSYYRLALSHWRADIYFHLIHDWDKAVRYTVKYASKGEKRSTAVINVFKRIISGSDHESDEACTILWKIFLKTVGERDISAREMSRLILGGKMASTSFTYVRIAVDSSFSTHQVNIDGSGEEFSVKKLTQDAYASRREVVGIPPS